MKSYGRALEREYQRFAHIASVRDRMTTVIQAVMRQIDGERQNRGRERKEREAERRQRASKRGKRTRERDRRHDDREQHERERQHRQQDRKQRQEERKQRQQEREQRRLERQRREHRDDQLEQEEDGLKEEEDRVEEEEDRLEEEEDRLEEEEDRLEEEEDRLEEEEDRLEREAEEAEREEDEREREEDEREHEEDERERDEDERERDEDRSEAIEDARLKKSGYRGTVHVMDALYSDALYQLVDYYPRGRGAGRRFSTRFGILGRAWRLKRSVEEPSVPTRTDRLINEWGMTQEQAADAARGRQSFVCIVLSDEGSPRGVLYLDARPDRAFPPDIIERFEVLPELPALQKAVIKVHSEIAGRGPALAGLDEV